MVELVSLWQDCGGQVEVVVRVMGGRRQQVLINPALTQLLVCASQNGMASGIVSVVPSEIVYTARKKVY